MTEFKLVINDPKSGRSFSKVVRDSEADIFRGKKIKDNIKGDSFILCAPNYGAPNRRSPNSKENKLSKLAKSLFRKSDGNFLGWTKVKPSKGEYFIDTDTRVEPFIGSLIPFLEKLKLKIIKKSSLWEIDDFSVKQLPFRFLGSLKIPPFDYWGQQIFVITKKRKLHF